MKKLIITENEKKNILSLYRIFEQTTTSGNTTTKKPMFGTPEQRAAALQKRKDNRQKIFDNFLKGAYLKNFYEEVDDETYSTGCTDKKSDEMPYIDGTSPNIPDYVYRELKDGKKIKINLKKYRNYVKVQNKQDWDDIVNNTYPEGLYTDKDLKNAEKSNTVDTPSLYFLSKLNPFKEKDGCIYTSKSKKGVGTSNQSKPSGY
jgi:hypothetical protein